VDVEQIARQLINILVGASSHPRDDSIRETEVRRLAAEADFDSDAIGDALDKAWSNGWINNGPRVGTIVLTPSGRNVAILKAAS
jgi:hypothetical protein